MRSILMEALTYNAGWSIFRQISIREFKGGKPEMDAWAWLTSQIGMFVVGILLLLIGYGYFKLGFSAKSLKLLRIGGLILTVLAVLSYAGINLFAAEEAPPATSVGSFDVTGTDSMSWITVDNNAQLITWAVTYNYTAGDFSGVGTAAGGAGAQSNSQYCLVSFTVDRGLGTVGLVQTYGDVTSVPSITNGTTGVSTPVLTKTNDQYNAIWTRADATTAFEMITITIAETADGAVVTLNMTLAATAVHSMSQYDTANIGILIGGETWTAQVLLANVS
jgi:hypothetical protein